MTTSESVNWTEANQSFLVAEFARLKARLAFKSDQPAQKRVPPPTLEPPSAIDYLSEIFRLSGFERDILLLCAGIEMDSRMATLCGEVQGNPQRAYATFGLAMIALADPHWSALIPSRPLRRFRLIELQPGYGVTTAPLRIDERILHFLAGMNLPDTRLEHLIEPVSRLESIPDEHQAAVAGAIQALENHGGELPVLHFCGDDLLGQEDVANAVALQAGRKLFMVRGEDLPAAGPDLDQFNILWQREAVLLPGALLIQCRSESPCPSVHKLAERMPGLVFVAGREPIQLTRACIRFDVNKPSPAEQRVLWEKALGPGAAHMNGMVDAVSSQFRLSARTIYSAGQLVAGGKGAELWNTCRSMSRPRLSDLAQRIIPVAGWDDLILPEPRKEVLRQIVCQVRHRMKVYEIWGFSAKGRRGLGVSALFTGESGTGKTMAAEVLANQLASDLYRIDLSSVVSKYIGETEKNLKQVFDAAEEGGVVLLFDEADALFGKRSEVKDSHDRYANIEVSYLLQRMEAYQGLAILTTNLKSTLDRAFHRRIRFTVNFPFPGAAQREAMWSRIFPARTPTRGLDHRRLSQLNMTGGNIRNIALNAAFLAAADGNDGPVEMGHLLRAAWLESEKIERPLSEAETRGWT